MTTGHSLWTHIPNAMSLGRLMLGLAFPWIPSHWRLSVVLIAALSDLFDGSLGRWTRSTSLAGQILDPIADKVFILGTLSTLVGSGLLTFSDLLLLGFRDVLVLGICLWVAARESWSEFRRMKPLWTGKLATAGQFVYLVALLYQGSKVFPLFATVVSVSILAGLHYAWAFGQALQARRDAAI